MAEINLKAVIFDMDGVLVDSEPVYDAVFDRWMWEHDFTPALKDQINQSLPPGITWEAVFTTVNSIAQTKFDPVVEQEKLSDRIVTYIMEVGVPLKPGAPQIVQQLAQRYQLGLASSSARRVIEQMLRHHGLYDYFQSLTGIEDVTYGKPHPEPYQRTMASLGVKPEETIVIEDSFSGAQSAAAAGAYVYVVPNGYFRPEVFTNIAEVVPNFDHIIKALL